MEKPAVYIGDMDRRVTFFENTTEKTSTGEPVETENTLGERWANRIDAGGDEEETGRLIGLGVCRFITRYDEVLFSKGSKMFIRDFDGDWQVNGRPKLIGPQRKTYIEFKCSLRGES